MSIARRPYFIRQVATLVVLGLLLPTLAHAELRKTGNANTTFTAKGPAGLSIVGKTPDLSVTERNGTIEIAVQLARLDTGLSLRNKHMREKYLEVQKYPAAQLRLERSALKVPIAGQVSGGSAQATITIRGRTKPVTVKYSAKNEAGTYVIDGTMRVNIKEFGIDVPSYLGVTVKPDIDIRAIFSAVDG